MSAISRTLDAITLFVEDRDRAREFYARAFDLEPIFEDENSAAFQLENVIVNLLVRSEANELIMPARVGAPGDGSRFQLTLGVEDTDRACEALGARGIDLLNGPIDRPWGVRTAAFADPDGHVWELASDLPKP